MGQKGTVCSERSTHRDPGWSVLRKREETYPLYQTPPRDSRPFALILPFDQDQARRVQEAGCSCGGKLSEHYEVSERTIRRWQRWWRETLPQKPIWAALRGRLARPISEAELPGSLLAAFDHLPDIAERVVAVLRCLLFPDPVSLLGGD